MAKITIDGKDVEISNESMAELRASLLPNGEQLIRDLEPGEYEICGKPTSVFSVPGLGIAFSPPSRSSTFYWVSDNGLLWNGNMSTKSYFGKPARDITADDIVRIEPKTGTALLDELEPGQLVAINGERCAVSIGKFGHIRIEPLLNNTEHASLLRDTDKWRYLEGLSEAIDKPVADLVASDIVQLYPKGE